MWYIIMETEVQESCFNVSRIISSLTHLHIQRRKTMCFKIITFSNLVFRDDFVFIWIRWMSHVVSYVSGSRWHPPHLSRVRGRLSKSPQRSRKYGHSLTQNVESIRRLLSNGILCSKHSKLNNFKFCYNMIQVWKSIKAFTRIFHSGTTSSSI